MKRLFENKKIDPKESQAKVQKAADEDLSTAGEFSLSTIALQLMGAWPYSSSGRPHPGLIVYHLLVAAIDVAFTVLLIGLVRRRMSNDDVDPVANHKYSIQLLYTGIYIAQSAIIVLVSMYIYQSIPAYLATWRELMLDLATERDAAKRKLQRDFKKATIFSGVTCITLMLLTMVNHLRYTYSEYDFNMGGTALSGGNTTNVTAAGTAWGDMANLGFDPATLVYPWNYIVPYGCAVIITLLIHNVQTFFIYFLVLTHCLTLMFTYNNSKITSAVSAAGGGGPHVPGNVMYIFPEGNRSATSNPELSRCLRRHLQMSLFVERCSEVFGMSLGVIQLTVIGQNLLLFYMIIAGLLDSTGMIASGCVFFVYNLGQFLACYLPAKLTDEAHDSEMCLYEYLTNVALPERDKEEINLFLSRTANRKVIFHVSRFYNLDRSVILTIYSAFVTYIIVLLQMAPR